VTCACPGNAPPCRDGSPLPRSAGGLETSARQPPPSRCTETGKPGPGRPPGSKNNGPHSATTSAADIHAELVGFAAALIVLLLIFGSVLGAVLPLATALVSVLAGISILGIVAAGITFGTSSPTLAAMIGIGVGIDYAVFLTTRFRQQMINGAVPAEAAGFCVTTSGRAVLLAGSTVAVALLGLYACGITYVGLLGLAAVFGVITAAAGAVTLVPACLGLAGASTSTRPGGPRSPRQAQQATAGTATPR